MKRSHDSDDAAHETSNARKAVKDSSSRSPNGHLPKISRKIRACQECQSRKIKCGIEPGESECARCHRLGLRCVVNKSLQTLLKDENEWKTGVDEKLQYLQTAVSEVLHSLNLPPLLSGSGEHHATPSSLSVPYVDTSLGGAVGSHVSATASPLHVGTPTLDRKNTATAMTRENSPEVPEQAGTEHDALVTAPMASLFEVTKLRNLRSNPSGNKHQPARHALRDDFISQGKISVEEAEELFGTFSRELSAYLWGGIALAHDSLTAVRESSPILTAAILAVTALHVPGGERVFDICYPIFLDLVSDSMFERYHTLDDVRGFCVGAFWLSDVSWKLSGHAVRIATELNLHQSFSKAIRGAYEHVEHARLWYFIYVCDHHFSIAYGRPPVIHEDAAVTYHESFLQLPGITQADHRLHSQVGVFIILSRIYSTFGLDSEKEVTEAEFNLIRGYDADLEGWRNKWYSRLTPNKYISNYPARGVILHYEFARLQLFSLALRGISPSSGQPMSLERREFIQTAIASASAALLVVLDDPDISASVVGVPLYLLTTIAFAAIFLIKVQLRWKCAQLNIDFPHVRSLLERIVTLLSDAKASARHLSCHIARGLRTILNKFKDRELREQQLTQGNNNGSIKPKGTEMNSVMPLDQTSSWGTLSPVPDGIYGDVMDLYGLDQEPYFPYGMFDALTTHMPG